MITFLSNLSHLTTSTPFWLSFALLSLSYLLLAPQCTTDKQRSWIMTLLSSAVMSIFSLPLVVQYSFAGGLLRHITIPYAATDSVGRFFQAYLLADLMMGSLFYPSKVNLLTGWIHHSVYVFIVDYAIQGHLSYIFCLCAVMEIPTFVFGLGSIMPRLRSDTFFALSFFTTRIALHIILCASLVTQRHDIASGSFGPAIIMACIFPVHASWFFGCLRTLFGRAKDVDRLVPHTTSPASLIAYTKHLVTPDLSGPIPLFYPSRMSMEWRCTALLTAMRAWWGQFRLWKADVQLCKVQRQVRAALPGRVHVYRYTGLERRRYSV